MLFVVFETSIRHINAHMVTVSQSIVERKLVMVVIFVGDVSLFCDNWANCGHAFHFAPVGSIKERSGAIRVDVANGRYSKRSNCNSGQKSGSADKRHLA